MGTTDTDPGHSISVVMDVTVMTQIQVAHIFDTLSRVESEQPWRAVEGAAVGLSYAFFMACGTDQPLDGNTVIDNGSYELTWLYNAGISVTPSQKNAFMAYLTRVRNQLQQELGVAITGATIKEATAILFD